MALSKAFRDIWSVSTLSHNGNLLVENRNGLIVNTEVFEANGTAERDAALVMLERIPGTK
jgi:hypothetical protein